MQTIAQLVHNEYLRRQAVEAESQRYEAARPAREALALSYFRRCMAEVEPVDLTDLQVTAAETQERFFTMRIELPQYAGYITGGCTGY